MDSTRTHRSELGTTIARLAAVCLVFGCSRVPGEILSTSPDDSSSLLADPLTNPPSLYEKAPAAFADSVGTLTRRTAFGPGSLNPLFSDVGADEEVRDLLFEPIFYRGTDLEYRLNEDLVESMEVSEDARRYILRFRPGLKWHDGEPWTARDVRFTSYIIDTSNFF